MHNAFSASNLREDTRELICPLVNNNSKQLLNLSWLKPSDRVRRGRTKDGSIRNSTAAVPGSGTSSRKGFPSQKKPPQNSAKVRRPGALPFHFYFWRGAGCQGFARTAPAGRLRLFLPLATAAHWSLLFLRLLAQGEKGSAS